MHANPAWLPPAYKDWDAFLADAVRRGMIQGHATTDVTRWTYGSWHVVPTLSIRSQASCPTSAGSPALGNSPQRRHHHREASGPNLWSVAALQHGLEQRRRVNRRHCAGRKRKPLQSLFSRSVGRLLQRPHLRVPLHPQPCLPTRSTPCDSSHERSGTGNRENRIEGRFGY